MHQNSFARAEHRAGGGGGSVYNTPRTPSVLPSPRTPRDTRQAMTSFQGVDPVLADRSRFYNDDPESYADSRVEFPRYQFDGGGGGGAYEHHMAHHRHFDHHDQRVFPRDQRSHYYPNEDDGTEYRDEEEMELEALQVNDDWTAHDQSGALDPAGLERYQQMTELALYEEDLLRAKLDEHTKMQLWRERLGFEELQREEQVRRWRMMKEDERKRLGLIQWERNVRQRELDLRARVREMAQMYREERLYGQIENRAVSNSLARRTSIIHSPTTIVVSSPGTYHKHHHRGPSTNVGHHFPHPRPPVLHPYTRPYLPIYRPRHYPLTRPLQSRFSRFLMPQRRIRIAPPPRPPFARRQRSLSVGQASIHPGYYPPQFLRRPPSLYRRSSFSSILGPPLLTRRPTLSNPGILRRPSFSNLGGPINLAKRPWMGLAPPPTLRRRSSSFGSLPTRAGIMGGGYAVGGGGGLGGFNPHARRPDVW